MRMFLLSALLLAGAAGVFAQGKKAAAPPFMIMIPDLKDGADLPVKFSCSNAPSGTSPKIEWMNAPAGTQSFAILLHDPEPHPAKSIYDVTHWFIYNIPGTATSLPEGVQNGAMADGTKHIKNIRGFDGYFGPCAPPGLNHHYTFELYALDTKLDLGADATRADAMKALDGISSATRCSSLFSRELNNAGSTGFIAQAGSGSSGVSITSGSGSSGSGSGEGSGQGSCGSGSGGGSFGSGIASLSAAAAALLSAAWKLRTALLH